MPQLFFDEIGFFHLLTSIFSLLFGSIVLFSKKGTKRHKQFGYAYVVNMLGVLISALFIYRLFGGFGVFHFLAVFGLVYLLVGVLPALFRIKNWIKWHVYFMYWSVIGLYAAFVAEVAVRIPNSAFWWMVGLGTALVTIIGGRYYGKNKDFWMGMGDKLIPKNTSTIK